MNIQFGKYNGQTVAEVAESDAQYLDWVLTTDISRFDGLREEIAATVTPVDVAEVELEEGTLPELVARVRGGGGVLFGVSEFKHYSPRYSDGKIVRKDVPIEEDSRSRSMRSGSFTMGTPTAPGVYYICETTGSIGNPVHTDSYWLRRDGEWLRILGGSRAASALAAA
jgi:hypothetical protein